MHYFTALNFLKFFRFLVTSGEEKRTTRRREPVTRKSKKKTNGSRVCAGPELLPLATYVRFVVGMYCLSFFAWQQPTLLCDIVGLYI